MNFKKISKHLQLKLKVNIRVVLGILLKYSSKYPHIPVKFNLNNS